MSVSFVSSSTISQILQNTVARLQSQMNTASTETSTGLVADIGLTLGANSGQDVNMHQQMADLSAITASNNVVTAQLGTASDALTSLQSATSSMLTQIVEGESGTPGSTGATALQQAAAGALATFSTTMNASVGGVFVFGGINSGTAPISTYATTPASAAQTAVDTAFQSAFGFAITSPQVSTISGAQMTSFLNGPYAALFSGSSWTSNWSSASNTVASNRIGANQSVPTSISANGAAFQGTAQALTMLSEFGGLNLSSSAYSALVNAAQTTMNTANNGLISANAEVGTMQNQVTDANSAITLQTNILTTQINSQEAVNSYDVASQVSSLTTQLQTAYSLTAQIHKLSLVSFL
jgi:flagellar hook-associated protein 3 FlgL